MTKLINDEFTDEARRLLKEGSWKTGDLRYNPVTGGGFVHGLDPLASQIKQAAAGLRARARRSRARLGTLSKLALWRVWRKELRPPYLAPTIFAFRRGGARS